MSRLFALTLAALAVPPLAHAAPPADAPERLLSPTSQLYVRWDGVAAHAETYKQSFWGPLMAGPTGDSVRALVAKIPKLLGSSLIADPLLDGKPPAELKANLLDIKNASKLLDLLADRGVVVGAEIREPKPTLKALGSALGGLIGGKPPSPDAFIPEVRVLVVIPDAAEKAESVFAALRLMRQSDTTKIEEFTVAGRKAFRVVPVPGGGAAPPRARGGRGEFIEDPEETPPIAEPQLAWWLDGKHAVVYLGTAKPEVVVADVAAGAEKGGVTAHPLFARCTAKPEFDSVARGFVDTARVVGLVKSLAGPLVPGLNARLDELGLGNLKAIVFNSGFSGRESRSVWDIDLPGERKGLAKVLKKEPIGLADLPPMPPDVSRFLAARIDPAALYDAGLGVVEALSLQAEFGVEEDAKNTADAIRLRREYLAKEFDKIIGVGVKDDVLPALGDKLVIYQSPNEGLSVFGTVVCVSLKDPAKAKAAADRIHQSIETLLSAPVKVRKKMLKGVEIRELYSRGFAILVPTYAIVGDWLVVGLHPQAVQGFVLRTKDELPRWKPDAATAARLAKMPKGCTLQYCDPTTTVKNLCVVGPLALGALGLAIGSNGGDDTDFDPIDVGLIPNGHELSKHLFPNLTVIRDDGTTVRIEANESLSIPLEIIGVEPVVIGASFFGVGFFRF